MRTFLRVAKDRSNEESKGCSVCVSCQHVGLFHIVQVVDTGEMSHTCLARGAEDQHPLLDAGAR